MLVLGAKGSKESTSGSMKPSGRRREISSFRLEEPGARETWRFVGLSPLDKHHEASRASLPTATFTNCQDTAWNALVNQNHRRIRATYSRQKRGKIPAFLADSHEALPETALSWQPRMGSTRPPPPDTAGGHGGLSHLRSDPLPEPIVPRHPVRARQGIFSRLQGQGFGQLVSELRRRVPRGFPVFG